MSAVTDALAGSRAEVFWSDRDDAPDRRPTLQGTIDADLVVVGGGFSGLWAAMHATAEPGRRVVVLEAERVGHGASSRNGGFCEASLTHGLHNGIAHWPDEIDTLVRLGAENLEGLLGTVDAEGIDAGTERVANLAVATEPWQFDDLTEGVDAYGRHGEPAQLLDADAVRARLDSPTYLGGVSSDGLAIVDPARLAWGLADSLERRGVSIYDGAAVATVDEDRTRLLVRTGNGSVRADRVVVATNAYRGPVRRQRRYVIPVWDHVLMTEPLSAAQFDAIGWSGREGVSDAGNQFHYYRLTEDDRILWGGYDATYHFGNKVDDALGQRPATHGMLAEHFFATFPQLEGLRFTHRWGGPIGTTSRFTATWGTSHGGRLSWVAGYTGLGVGASRFGARVALDLVDGIDTESTSLSMVRRHPFPFPPEPLRWPAVEVTRRAIVRADGREGRRGPWLALLDKFGIGFDS
jgi:glycine/D-amino acid oxidase-like deaminating enzyme